MSVNLSRLSHKQLFQMERQIARKYIDRMPVLMIIWSVSNFLVWLSLWPLVLLNIIPLWLGFIVATFNVLLSYLPSHDAQHSIIAKPGERLRWLNETVGWIGSIPLTIPYPVLRATHLEHHKHCNDPQLDPDIYTRSSNALHAIWRIVYSRQPRTDGQKKKYQETLERLGRDDLILMSALARAGFYGFLSLMAWNGMALEAALLWWLPAHIATTYLAFFLSWAPHHPAASVGRYNDTRAWKSQVGNILSMGMQYHLVHHLHPPPQFQKRRPATTK